MISNANDTSGRSIVRRGRELLATWREAVAGSVRDGTDAREADAGHAAAFVDGSVAEPEADGDEPAVDDGVGSSIERVEREAYVEELLDENDGRLWQREIVSRTEVSSSTVSRWLSAMEDDERVVRIQIGREKLVALPDAGLEAAAAPAQFQQAEE